MKLSEKARADYKIHIDCSFDSCVEYSSKELSSYLKKITGREFEVEKEQGEQGFYLGTVEKFPLESLVERNIAEKIYDDGFAIYEKGGNIVIIAKRSRGVLYGVYDYLERFYGVRFLTNDFEYVPLKGEIVFPEVPVISNPDFLMRGYFIGDSYKDERPCDDPDFAFVAKNRVKDIFLEIPQKFGGGNNVYGRNHVHNFHFYVPFETYGNSHPEWYRFFYVNKTITPTIDITNGITDDGKLDESMEESVAKVVIKELLKDAEDHPDKSIFNLTQEDGDYYYESLRNTQLEKKYKRSGMLVRFCNVIVREVNRLLREKNKREIKIVTFAYAYTKEAPVFNKGKECVPLDETVVADENLIIQLALFQNGIYSYFSEKQDEEVRRIMDEWKTVASNFWFWMYDINFHKYLYYFDSFDEIDENVRGFKDYGISYLCVNGPYEEGRNWQCNIRAYAYRKLMWDVNLSSEKLMDEYIDLYYGCGAPYVKKMMDIFHKNSLICKKDENYRLATYGSAEKSEYNPRDMLLLALDTIEQGERAILNNLNYSNEEKKVFENHILCVKVTPLIMLYDMYFQHRPSAPLKEYLDLKEKFFETVKRARVKIAGEHWNMEQFRQECDEMDEKAGHTL